MFDGIWAYEIASGKSHLLGDITAALKKSFRDKSIAPAINHYTNANTVDADGWIYVGMKKGTDLYGPQVSALRLMAMRTTKTP